MLLNSRGSNFRFNGILKCPFPSPPHLIHIGVPCRFPLGMACLRACNARSETRACAIPLFAPAASAVFFTVVRGDKEAGRETKTQTAPARLWEGSERQRPLSLRGGAMQQPRRALSTWPGSSRRLLSEQARHGVVIPRCLPPGRLASSRSAATKASPHIQHHGAIGSFAWRQGRGRRGRCGWCLWCVVVGHGRSCEPVTEALLSSDRWTGEMALALRLSNRSAVPCYVRRHLRSVRNRRSSTGGSPSI